MESFADVDMTADPGEDRTLIRELLMLTPRQRLETLRRDAAMLAAFPLGALVGRERRAG